MNKVISTLILIGIVLIGVACSSLDLAQIQKEAGKYMNTTPSNERIASGLKEALEIGAKKAGSSASLTDGFYKNQLLYIAFPPEAAKVEDKLRQLGFNSLVDDFVKSMNRGAEKAAKEAAPIFVNAIKSMSINDAMGILKGSNDAATTYLKRTTGDQLNAKFNPIISNSLAEVNATKYWTDVINTYNKIPGVQQMNPNLNEYVTSKAIDGLFILVKQEEANIRANPGARVTDVLKEVFGYADTVN